MNTVRRTLAYCYLALVNLVYATSIFAAEQGTPEPSFWPWWHGAHWHPFWWIFPLIFFVLMIVMCILMMRRGGMGCMWRDWMERPDYRDVMKRDRGERSESALDILDKRYARGEIDNQEYEEKKAALTRS